MPSMSARPHYQIALFDTCRFSGLGYQAYFSTCPEVSEVRYADTAETFRNLLRQRDRVDVVIVGFHRAPLRMYDRELIAFLDYFYRNYPCCPLILYSDDTEFFTFYSDLYDHPWVMLQKSQPLATLRQTITLCSQKPPRRRLRRPFLSGTERYTLALLIKGLTPEQVAKIGICSEKTVSSHKTNALKKIFPVSWQHASMKHPNILLSIPRTIYTAEM